MARSLFASLAWSPALTAVRTGPFRGPALETLRCRGPRGPGTPEYATRRAGKASAPARYPGRAMPHVEKDRGPGTRALARLGLLLGIWAASSCAATRSETLAPELCVTVAIGPESLMR